MASWVRRFNGQVAAAITSAVGTMWCAYGFTALALVSLPAALATRNTVVIVAWIAQTFLQLVLLSVIIVGQNIAGARTEAVINDSHDKLAGLVGELSELIGDGHATLRAVHALLTADPAENAAAVALIESTDPSTDA